MVAVALANPASSAGPLLGVRLGDPLRLEGGDVGRGVEARPLDLSGVDDVDDVGDGDRRLPDVGRQDDLSTSGNGLVESRVLVGHVDERVQEVDVGVVVDDDVVDARFGGLR